MIRLKSGKATTVLSIAQPHSVIFFGFSFVFSHRVSF